ncbi:hypothetical protein K505DRAFT_377702 [Melanomma pulvis-pyrius CBS 109.77]|uniref:Uncharacterized protein n=1 Tax=Melanomma pulvis-pyrius CBS 109.77 TaxID=1314802 RepID=A0A6A6X124_9PLEO|nr:hypothetical protein K505DRAFT_377702 [Melanomma pulvis-pyrius CBS 109.77]
MSTSNPIPIPVAHERDIPSIATIAVAKRCVTKLSFAVATSMAVAKRLTWEQTPWLLHSLSEDDIRHIAKCLSVYKDGVISNKAIYNALFFGETDRDVQHNEYTGPGPQLFVLFPHVRRDIRRDASFLAVWHDELVLPAFNTAWRDSGLVETSVGSFQRKQGRPSTGFIAHLKAGRRYMVRDSWPAWYDSSSGRVEGKFSDKRAHVFDEAWKSITGMLKDYPGLHEFQDPMLIVVDRGRSYLDCNYSPQEVYQSVARDWDISFDSRYVVPGSFKVVVEDVLGTVRRAQKDVDKEEVDMAMDMLSVDFKRKAEIELDAGGRKEKRARG